MKTAAEYADEAADDLVTSFAQNDLKLKRIIVERAAVYAQLAAVAAGLEIATGTWKRMDELA